MIDQSPFSAKTGHLVAFNISIRQTLQAVPADEWLQVQVNVHVQSQLGAVRKTLSTVVTFERLVAVSRVHRPHVFLHVDHLLSTEGTSRPLSVSFLHVSFHVDLTLEHFTTYFTRCRCF